MQGAAAIMLITLGIGQFLAAAQKLGGLSLTGRYRWSGLILGLVLVGLGSIMLPQTAWALFWTPVAGVVAVALLLLGGSFIAPIPNPNVLFKADYPGHNGCEAVQIPDGSQLGPGLLVHPKDFVRNADSQADNLDRHPADPASARRATTMPSEKIAVCIVPGAGDTKLFFKWQLVKALLAHGITVLIIDPPGHGDYRHRPLVYPDCLTAVPAAIAFLRKQPNIKGVGLLGISLGGAMAIRAVAGAGSAFVDALGVVATPTQLNYSQRLFYKEVWRTFYRSPVVPLLQEVTARQARAMWRSGGYRGQHTTAEMFDLLDPLGHIGQVAPTPLLLVYSQRDAVASTLHAEALHQAAPYADLIVTKKASHVMLTLTPEINMQIAGWFHARLSK